MSLLAELKDSLLLRDFDDIRNALTMQNLIEQVHSLGSTNLQKFLLRPGSPPPVTTHGANLFNEY